MNTAKPVFVLALVAAAVLAGGAADAAIVYQAQLIGNPGADGVATTYGMGKYNVTISQYTAFLNATAATDTYSLYNPSMGTDLNVAGIARAGSPGSYTYSVIGSSGNHPVTYISWFDAARMANWLHNGQPTGGQVAGVTETGAYTLNGATTGNTITTNSGANYYIPSVAEWRKAAFYDPNHGGEWLYSTQTNTAPGNQVGNLPNQMNLTVAGKYSVTQSSTYSSAQDYLTDVGAYTGSASYYGTYDQGGSVWNWTTNINSTARWQLGGSWGDTEQYARNNQQGYGGPIFEFNTFGFRLATSAAVVPEPAAAGLLAIGLAALAMRRRRA